MVERPIKKSERQAVTESTDVVKAPETEPITTEGAKSEAIPKSSPESPESTDVVTPETEPIITTDAKSSPESTDVVTPETEPIITTGAKSSPESTDVVTPETEPIITTDAKSEAIAKSPPESSKSTHVVKVAPKLKTEPITNQGVQETVNQSPPESPKSTHVVKAAPKIKPIITASAQFEAITKSPPESNESNDVIKVPETEPTTTTDAQPDAITQVSEERSITKPLLAKDKKKGKGRGDQRKDEQSIKPPASLALMRGPKPTKAKPPVMSKTQEETSDLTLEVDQEET